MYVNFNRGAFRCLFYQEWDEERKEAIVMLSSAVLCTYVRAQIYHSFKAVKAPRGFLVSYYLIRVSMGSAGVFLVVLCFLSVSGAR